MHTIYSSDGTYSVCPSRPDGTIVWISPIIRKDMKYKCITVKLVEQRLAEGWSDYQAIHLSTKYVTHDGEICYKYSSPERTLYIPLSDIEKAQEEYELNTRTISKRLNRGMGLYEALTTLPAGAQDSVEKDVKKYQKIEDEKEKKRQQRLSYYRERKKRERKPHMYDGTPQQHTFGKYAQYLADSYKFKCAEVVK